MTEGQATFHLKGKRYRGQPEVRGQQIIIGSGPTATVRLDDPMLADHHLTVLYQSGRFWVRDLGSTSGTYVNGEPAREMTPLEEGSSLVFGLTEIGVSPRPDQASLELAFRPRGFHYDREKDPVRWSKIESKFGVFPGLKLANVIGIALTLGALGLLALWPEQLSPGPVSSVHHQAIEEEGGHACDSCHAPFGGTPASRCESCHADLMQNSHPFGTWNSDDCTRCHAEHDSSLPGALLTRPASSTCGDCHEEDRPLNPDRPLLAVEMKSVEIAYNTFSHASHVTDHEISCESCHVRSAGESSVPGAPDEFGPVSFETCQKCHSPDAPEETRSEKTFTARWHGTEEHGKYCLQCHAEVGRGELKEITRQDREATFRLTSRSHREELEKHSGGQPCSQCHRREEVGGGRALSSRFQHATHVSRLEVDATEPEGLKALSEECANCHTDRAESESLVSGAFVMPPPEACDRCHVDAGGDALRPEPVSGEARGEPRTISDFPHRFHLDTSHPDLERGCFTCHEFTGEGGLDRQPLTLDSARDCTSCHEGHRNLAGDGCRHCHLEGDFTLAAEPGLRDWPVTGNFSHFSPGHASITETGAEGCLRCHGGAEKATTIQDVPIPREADASCRTCHIENRSRFHWR